MRCASARSSAWSTLGQISASIGCSAVLIGPNGVAAKRHSRREGVTQMALLGGTIETPQELYVHKLGAALKMEKTILDMLPQLEEHANDSQLKQSLRQHYDETQRHVANLERAFQALGAEVDESSCPAIEGLEKEGQANLKMVDDSLNDHVIIGGVTETEHHEIAVYEGLITKAEAMGEQDIVALLQENLEQEQAMLQKGKQIAQQLAQRVVPTA